MDITEEQMTQTEMLEKIAELDHSKNQLKKLNTEMRHWLDVADEDMAALRSENTALTKQVKDLEKMVRDAQQDDAESFRTLANDLDVKRCNEEKILTLEQESTTLKEENKKLTAEVKNLQLQQQQDKISLNKLRASLQTLESEMEEAQVGLHCRNEVIHQKFLQLKHAEETVEEYSTVIKDLRLTNQELREQLEAGQDELSLAIVNDMMGTKRGTASPPLSFTDEMKQLASFADAKTCTPDLREPKHEEAEAEELLKPQSQTADPHTKRCAGALETVIQKARQFMLCLFVLAVLAFVASGSFTGNFFSTDAFWSRAHLAFQPYCSLHYGSLPPI